MMSPQNVYTQVMSMVNHVCTAVRPDHTIPQTIQRHGRQLIIGPLHYELEDGRLPDGRLFVVSVGKAAVPMAQVTVDLLGDLIYAGVGVSKQEAAGWETGSFAWFTGDHPVSGPKSVWATTAVADLLDQTRPGDLVLCLLSGGASALLTQPLIPLAEWQALNRALLASGCTIQEFNTVRRQLDGIKGGGLAWLAAPAQVVCLILSDVVGNDLAAIGSGPTVLVKETPHDALAVLRRYGIEEVMDTAVWHNILAALNQQLESEPGPLLPTPTNLIIGSVRQAAEAARQQAETLGFTATILTAHLEGEAREVGKFAAAIAKELLPGHCVILGGETTVTLRGDGRGGRNLEVALSAAIALAGWPDVAVAAFATDGEDSTTGMAGAVVTGGTTSCGLDLQLAAVQFLDNNDSFTYFQSLDSAGYGPHLLNTGPTGTNVNDLIFIIHNS